MRAPEGHHSRCKESRIARNKREDCSSSDPEPVSDNEQDVSYITTPHSRRAKPSQKKQRFISCIPSDMSEILLKQKNSSREPSLSNTTITNQTNLNNERSKKVSNHSPGFKDKRSVSINSQQSSHVVIHPEQAYPNSSNYPTTPTNNHAHWSAHSNRRPENFPSSTNQSHLSTPKVSHNMPATHNFPMMYASPTQQFSSPQQSFAYQGHYSHMSACNPVSSMYGQTQFIPRSPQLPQQMTSACNNPFLMQPCYQTYYPKQMQMQIPNSPTMYPNSTHVYPAQQQLETYYPENSLSSQQGGNYRNWTQMQLPSSLNSASWTYSIQ